MNPLSQLYNLVVEAFRLGLDAIFGFTGNYALAIIVLTVVFNLLFTPFRIKQTRTTKLQKLLQPKIDAINKKYKDDKEKASKETMELWNKYNFNPLAGCGSSLLQLPLFFAILEVFRNLEFPEGAASAFMWIENISLSEPAFLGISLMNFDLKILPLLAGAAFYAQSQLMGTTGDKNTQLMMSMMPLMMVAICWGQPASLSIYWTTSQLVNAIQQAIMQQRITVEVDAADLV